MGSTGHAGLEYLKSTAGVDIVHVPYKGIAPALADMASGQLHLAFATTISGSPHVRSGRLRALAVTSTRRAQAYPALPAVAETVPGFELTNWYGLFAPARTPTAIISALHRVATQAIKSPDLQARIAAGGAEAAPSRSPVDFRTLLEQEVAKWQKIMALPGFSEILK
jgi:tripartite-type tricarboxylate transporter receptor subunit TctC